MSSDPAAIEIQIGNSGRLFCRSGRRTQPCSRRWDEIGLLPDGKNGASGIAVQSQIYRAADLHWAVFDLAVEGRVHASMKQSEIPTGPRVACWILVCSPRSVRGALNLRCNSFHTVLQRRGIRDAEWEVKVHPVVPVGDRSGGPLPIVIKGNAHGRDVEGLSGEAGLEREGRLAREATRMPRRPSGPRRPPGIGRWLCLSDHTGAG